jgi:hypothetical protein
VYRVEAFGIVLRQPHVSHSSDLEARVFDALDQTADQSSLNGVGLDDG